MRPFWFSSPALMVCLSAFTLGGCITARQPSLVEPRMVSTDLPAMLDLSSLGRYKSDYGAYKAAAEGDKPDLERARYFRNKLTDRGLADIDQVYGEYVDALSYGKSLFALESDAIGLGLSAASTISLVTHTKTILSALATAFTGAHLSYDKNFFGQQTLPALGIAMQARRSAARKSIAANKQLAVTEYTVEGARRDLIAYFYAGTLTGAIQEIQEEAGAKTSESNKAQPGPAPTGSPGVPAKLTFQDVVSKAKALTVTATVLDGSGTIVTALPLEVAINTDAKDAKPRSVKGSAVDGKLNGTFTFGDEGKYTLMATAPGVEPTSMTVTVTKDSVTATPVASPAPARQPSRDGLN